ERPTSIRIRVALSGLAERPQRIPHRMPTPSATTRPRNATSRACCSACPKSGPGTMVTKGPATLGTLGSRSAESTPLRLTNCHSTTAARMQPSWARRFVAGADETLARRAPLLDRVLTIVGVSRPRGVFPDHVGHVGCLVDAVEGD